MAKKSGLAYDILGDIKKVSLNPGDVVLIEHHIPMARNDLAVIQKQFELVFPGHKVVVMQAGMKMKVVEQESN